MYTVVDNTNILSDLTEIRLARIVDGLDTFQGRSGLQAAVDYLDNLDVPDFLLIVAGSTITINPVRPQPDEYRLEMWVRKSPNGKWNGYAKGRRTSPNEFPNKEKFKMRMTEALNKLLSAWEGV